MTYKDHSNRNDEVTQETETMTTPEHHTRHPHRRGHKRANREAFLAGFEMGRQFREAWAGESDVTEPEITRRPRHGGGHRRRPDSEFGRYGGRAGAHARAAFAGMRGEREHRPGPHLIQEMQAQIDELERRMRRMQRKARMQATSPDERVEIRKIVRTRRVGDAGREHSCNHSDRRMRGEGRRMGQMAYRTWKDSGSEA